MFGNCCACATRMIVAEKTRFGFRSLKNTSGISGVDLNSDRRRWLHLTYSVRNERISSSGIQSAKLTYEMKFDRLTGKKTVMTNREIFTDTLTPAGIFFDGPVPDGPIFLPGGAGDENVQEFTDIEYHYFLRLDPAPGHAPGTLIFEQEITVTLSDQYTDELIYTDLQALAEFNGGLGGLENNDVSLRHYNESAFANYDEVIRLFAESDDWPDATIMESRSPVADNSCTPLDALVAEIGYSGEQGGQIGLVGRHVTYKTSRKYGIAVCQSTKFVGQNGADTLPPICQMRSPVGSPLFLDFIPQNVIPTNLQPFNVNAIFITANATIVDGPDGCECDRNPFP